MMRDNRLRVFSLSAVVLVVAVVTAFPVSAVENGWAIRVEGLRIAPDLDYRLYADDGYPVDATDEGDIGFGLSVIYRYTGRVGLEIGLLQANPGVRLVTDFGLGGANISFSDDLSMRSFVAALEFHLTPTHMIDVYVSPMIVSTSYGSLEYAVELPTGGEEILSIDVRDDVGWGIGLGAQVPLGGSPWRGAATIRFLDSTLDVHGPEDDFEDTLDFDSLVISLGVDYRF